MTCYNDKEVRILCKVSHLFCQNSNLTFKLYLLNCDISFSAFQNVHLISRPNKDQQQEQ